MTTLVLEQDPVAVHVTLSAGHLSVELADGRSLIVPLQWYPRLLNFHARYRRSERQIDIDALAVIEGKLPARALGLVIEWAALH